MRKSNLHKSEQVQDKGFINHTMCSECRKSYSIGFHIGEEDVICPYCGKTNKIVLRMIKGIVELCECTKARRKQYLEILEKYSAG